METVRRGSAGYSDWARPAVSYSSPFSTEHDRPTTSSARKPSLGQRRNLYDLLSATDGTGAGPSPARRPKGREYYAELLRVASQDDPQAFVQSILQGALMLL